MEQLLLTNLIGVITQIFHNIWLKLSFNDLLAEREGYQHRIKSLEAQVVNLEQLIEDVDTEVVRNRTEMDRHRTEVQAEVQDTAPVCSFFGGPPVTNYSTNNSNNTEEPLDSALDSFPPIDEVTKSATLIPLRSANKNPILIIR